MPYRSEAERRHMRKHYPTIADAWDREEATAIDTQERRDKLPERVSTKPAKVSIWDVAARLVNKPQE